MAKNGCRFISIREAKELDLKAQKKFGMPVLLLMENAGRAVFEESVKVAKKKNNVVVLCGKGNNGGDGFAACRHFLACGIKPEIFLAGKACEVYNEAKINLDILKRMKQKIFEIDEGNLDFVRKRVLGADFIIDALLGVGLFGDVRGVYRDLINMINSSSAYVLSVDIPSGLDANTGRVLGCCVKANKTVTFVAKKLGMTAGEGVRYCGRIAVKDLGLPFF